MARAKRVQYLMIIKKNKRSHSTVLSILELLISLTIEFTFFAVLSIAFNSFVESAILSMLLSFFVRILIKVVGKNG